MKDLIFNLCSAYGVSGDEIKALKVAEAELSKYADVTIDNNNNLIAVLGNKKSDKNIMLDAHIDQIGLIVKHIDNRGFIFYDLCGGIDAKALVGSCVKILGKEEITGVIGILPPHLMKGENKKLPAPNELFIDTGLKADKVKEIVSLGDRVVFYNPPQELIGNKITSVALDDRSGVASLIECAKIIKEYELNCKVTIVLTSNEETTASGATTVAYKINPDECIGVDVSFADEDNTTDGKLPALGSGAMIGISACLSNEMSQRLQKIAKNNNIPYTLEAMGGRTGTNMDEINLSRNGIKSGLVSIPLKYMHTPVEVIDLNDVNSVAQLLAMYVKEYSEEIK